MDSKFKGLAKANGTIEFVRAGIATSVVVPEDIKKRLTYEANVVDGKIVFGEGESIYIIADEVGFIGGKDTGVETNLFFIDGGMVFELISGKIAMRGENGEVYTVDEMGDIDYPRANARINWVTTKNVLDIAKIVIRNRYVTNEELTLAYANNLVMNVFLQFEKANEGYVFNTKFYAYYEDLGLGKFEFINFGETEYEADEDTDDIADLVDVEDEEDEEDDEYDMSGEEEGEEDEHNNF